MLGGCDISDRVVYDLPELLHVCPLEGPVQFTLRLNIVTEIEMLSRYQRLHRLLWVAAGAFFRADLRRQEPQHVPVGKLVDEALRLDYPLFDVVCFKGQIDTLDALVFDLGEPRLQFEELSSSFCEHLRIDLVLLLCDRVLAGHRLSLIEHLLGAARVVRVAFHASAE